MNEQIVKVTRGLQEKVTVKYSEHDKLHAIHDRSQACNGFLEFCREEHGLTLWDSCNDCGPLKSVRQLLAEFFEIDEARLETEKLEMLGALRALNERKP